MGRTTIPIFFHPPSSVEFCPEDDSPALISAAPTLDANDNGALPRLLDGLALCISSEELSDESPPDPPPDIANELNPAPPHVGHRVLEEEEEEEEEVVVVVVVVAALFLSSSK